MNEELRKIVEAMVRAGESEENIALVIKNFKPKAQTLQDYTEEQSQVSEIPQEELIKREYSSGGIVDRLQSAAGNFNQQVLNAPAAILKTIGIGAKKLTDLTDFNPGGPQKGAPVDEYATYKAGKAWEDYINSTGLTYTNPNYSEGFDQQLSSGLGSLVTLALTRGRPTPSSALTQTATTSAPRIAAQQAGNMLTSRTGVVAGSWAVPEYEAAIEAGLSDDEAFNVFLKNYFVNQTDAIPIERAFSGLNKLFKGSISQKVRAIGEGGLVEGLQEGVQTYLTNQIAKGSYDPERDELFQVLESVSVGGVLGMLLPGLGAAMDSNPRLKQALAPKIAKLEQRAIALDEANKAVEDTPTGDIELDNTVDQFATLTEGDIEGIKARVQTEQLENAVQESETTSADVRQQTEDGETVGERDTQEQTPAEKEVTSNIVDKTEESVQNNEQFTETGTEQKREQATQKLAELTERLKEDITPEQEQEVYRQLAETKQVLREVAGREPSKTSEVKKAIEKATGIAKEEKSVKLTPSQATEAQIKILDRGIKLGEKMTKTDLVQKVQDAVKDAPLTPNQVSAILGKTKRTSLDNTESLQTYIDKVVKDAQYAEQITHAERVGKDVKKGMKTTTPQERTPLRLFSAIDPSEISNPGEYTQVGNSIKDSFKPKTKGYKPLELPPVNAFLDRVTQEMYTNTFGHEPGKSLTPEQRYNEVRQKQYKDRQEKKLSKLADKLGLNLEERQALLESDTSVEDKITAENKAEQIREELSNTAKVIRPLLNTVEDVESENQPILESIKKINPDDLTIADLKEYVEVVDRITINNDFGGSQNMAALGRALEGITELTPRLSKHVMNISQLSVDVTASFPQLFKGIFGLSKDASLFRLKAGMVGISQARAEAGVAGRKLGQGIVDIHEKFKKLYGANNSGFTSESIARRSVYYTLIKHDSAVDGDEFMRTGGKSAITTSIDSYREAGDEETATLLETLYQPFKDASSIDEVHQIMEKVDPQGKKVFELIKKGFDGMEGQVAHYNETHYSDYSQRVNNYAGETEIVNLLKSGKDTTVDKLKSGTLKPERLDSSKRFTGKVPKGHAIKLGFDVNAVRSMEKTVFKIKADPYILQANQFAKQREKVLKLFGKREGDSKSSKVAKDIYRKIFDPDKGAYKSFLDESAHAGMGRHSETEQKLTQILSMGHKIVYTANLSGVTQIPKQYTVLISTAINLGVKRAHTVATSAIDIKRDKEGAKEFFEGKPIGERGNEQTIASLGEGWDSADVLSQISTLRNFIGRDLPSYLNSKFNSWWGGLKPLLVGDASAAQISYVAFYKEHLEKNGQEFLGFKDEKRLESTKERQEAHAYADQRVSETQVASTTAELAPGVRTKSTGGKILKANLIPFGSFNLNKKERLATDMKLIAVGDNAQRKEAAKDMTAAIAESITFVALKRAIQGTFGAGIVLGLRELYHLDDPEDDDEKRLRKTRQFTQDITEVITDNIPATLFAAEPAKNAFIAGAEYLIYWWHKQENPDITKKEFEEETGISLRPPNTNPYTQFAGTYGKAVDIMTDGFEYFTEGTDDDNDLDENQKKLALTAALFQFGANAGIGPADIRTPIVSEYRKQKRLAKKSNSIHNTELLQQLLLTQPEVPNLPPPLPLPQ